MTSGATISDCGRYRYRLWRTWEINLPTLCFVMLNPSTANECEDDPTIRRCLGFARRDGFGGISVTNLFAFRATDPAELSKVSDPVGPLNEEFLLRSRGVALMTRLVAAWGASVPWALRSRARCLSTNVSVNDPQCLGVTKDGSPRHPLYVKADTLFVPWRAH